MIMSDIYILQILAITISHGCTEQGEQTEGQRGAVQSKPSTQTPHHSCTLVIVSYLKKENKKTTDIHNFDWCN